MSAIRQFSSYATVFLLFFSFFFASKNLVAQAPEGVNYQAVARDNNGDPLANQIVSVRFSIVATSTSGTVLYEEEHSTISTNDFGLFNLIIGQGTKTGGTAANFAAVDWGSGNRYLRVQVDAGNGFENLGTTQLLSVPYALYSKTSGNSSTTTLKGGDGIILRNDSIINDGDLSDNNELITSFTIETGNILRITEASTNYDIDLTPYLNSSSDDQNLSIVGDSIKIENGNAVSIKFILDDIAANAADIITTQTDIINNATGIIDSTNDIRAALLDSAADLRTLFGNGSDNQNLSLLNDTIFIEDGNSVDLTYIKDSLADHNSKIYGNVADIFTNQTAISNNATGIIDSTNNIRAALVDSAADLRTLFSSGSDNQNLSLLNDTIFIEDGNSVDLTYIKDSLADHNSKIYGNVADISNHSINITTLNTYVSDLQSSFYIDSLLTLQNQDSIAILTALVSNTSDDQNLSFVNDSIVIEDGTGVDLAYIKDSLADHNSKIYSNITDIETNAADIVTNQNAIVTNITSIANLNTDLSTLQSNFTLDSNLTIQNHDSINILVGLIGADNDTSASNEIQQLSLIADQLRIDDPSGATNPMPIDLSIYNTTEDSTRIANGTSRIFIPTTNDSISFVAGGVEALRINNTGTSYFKQQVGVNTTSPGALLGVLSNNQGIAQINRAVGRDTEPVGLSLDVDGGSSGLSATGITSTSYGTGKSIGIRSFARTTSATDSTIAFFASANGTENSFSGFFKNGNVYIGDTLILPLNAGRGKVLTSDANGKASWNSPSSIGSGNLGELTFFTADDSLRSSSKLFWDETNKRLGIGMNTPAAKLCIWDTLANGSNTSINVRTYADNTFAFGNIYGINSYIENEPFISIDTAFGLKTRVTGDAEYKMGVHAYVYGGPTPQKYYALYGVADGSQEAYGIYTKAINGSSENWSAYLDTGDVYVEDTLVFNRTFKLATGASNGSVLTSDANGVASWQPTTAAGNVNTAGSNTAGRVAYWNDTDSVTFFDDLFIDVANNRIGIGTIAPTQKLQVNGGIRVSAGFNANNGTQGSPAFRFEADPNTGMFSDVADELAFTTGGTEVARFDANGNFGIGTATPDSTLTINGGIKTTYFTMTNGAVSGRVLTSDANGVATWEALPGTDTLNIIADPDRNTSISIDGSDIIHFNQNGTEFFRMDSGKVEVFNTGNSIFIGEEAGSNDDYSSANGTVAIGYRAGRLNVTADGNTAIGTNALRQNTSPSNTAVGAGALSNNSTGMENTAVGTGIMQGNTFGSYNTALGALTLTDNTTGTRNVAIGFQTARNINGSSNVFIGSGAGTQASLQNISNSIFIGWLAGSQETNSNRLYIENSNSSTPLIYGNFASDSVKIFGTLGVGNEYSFPDTAGTPAQILVADASGKPVWSSTLPAATCPTGMSNIAGTNICIDTDERAASSNWFDAAATCVSAGYKLPTWAEWYGAAAALTLTNETDDWEWVSDGTSNTARKVGNGDIKATANDDPDTGGASYRCIYYK